MNIITDTSLPPPDAVLSYWFGDATVPDVPGNDRSALWFGGGPELDADMRQRFGPLVAQAHAGGLTEWESPLLHRLALVIVLDQFSRNVYRGQAQAFAGDARAQTLVLRSLALGQDQSLPTTARVFFYMPLMHAESLALQRECVARLEALAADSPPETARRLQGNLQAAHQHRDIIERFGRFPHRNAALGRTSTAAETAFLTDGPRFGQ
jgi:uncharacterized protein (DUF924 family)